MSMQVRTRCADCVYWDGLYEDHSGASWGECRRRAKVGEGWPRTRHRDWCGELVTSNQQARRHEVTAAMEGAVAVDWSRPIASD